MKALLNWFDDRTGYRNLVREALYEPIPGGARWRYVWGSTLTFVFVVQVITGMFLWTAYSPSAQTAWESVYHIQYVMHFGWLLRGIHHYAAQAMVVLLALHFMQVVVDSAYRAPREINFWLGVVLLQIVLFLSLTGYLLPWDQKGYYATKVATNIMGATPVVGTELQHTLQGGSEYGHQTLTRFFALHAGILPTLLVVFLALHIYVFRRHAITPAHPEKNRKFAVVLTFLFGPAGLFYAHAVAAFLMALVIGGEGWAIYKLRESGGWSDGMTLTVSLIAWFATNAVFSIWAAKAADEFEVADAHFWPDQLLKDVVACLGVLTTILLLAVFLGVELSAPADATEPYSAARPEWYFLFLFRFLKFEAVDEIGIVFGAIIVPGLIMTVIVLMPIVGRWKLGHRFNVAFVGALMIGVLILTGTAMVEDARNEEFQAAKETAERDGRRTVALADAFGIPISGARDLLRTDPLTQGPKIFARNCSSCHRYNGHDGTGTTPEGPATAADLGNFGSREWLHSVLTDYKDHFAPLKNATFPGKEQDEVGQYFLEDGSMVQWVDSNKETIETAENEQALDALIEFVVRQSDRDDLAPFNAALVDQGRNLWTKTSWPGGNVTQACSDCHQMHAAGDDEELSGDGGYYAPMLTGYGGKGWLKQFISNPGDDGGETEHFFYAENNAMPAFSGRLSDEELDLLVRWMTGDYYRPESDGG